MLYIFGGLPATGKSTLSLRLAQQVQAVHLRIDTIEQAIRNGGGQITGPEGYLVGYQVAADNLKLGHRVVADSVNPLHITRRAWRSVAESIPVPYVEIEVVCTDRAEHRQRAEMRIADIPGHAMPSWNEITQREYERWTDKHIIVDTAGKTIEASFRELLQSIDRCPANPHLCG
jgi:predicted kinase